MKSLATQWARWVPDQTAWFEHVVSFLIIIAPLFYLSVPHWLTNISVICVILILLISIFHKNYFSIYQDWKLLPIAGVFSAYFFAILISQLGRGSFVTKEYLDQTRWLLGIPIFAFLMSVRINFSLALSRLAPFIIFFAWVSSTFIIPSNAWGDRATIQFMDPLAFGFMNLSLGMMCLVAATLELRAGRKNIWAMLGILGFLLGLYLSVRSGSRTGWFAFPIVMLLIVKVWFVNLSGRRIYAFLLVTIPIVAIYFFSTTVSVRLTQFANEISSYPWHGGVAPDTSVGMRITFYRLGAFYFSESPWFGWGDRGYLPIKDAVEVASFSTAYARDFAYNALFHSEWTTQTVRFGLLGLISVFWVFSIPFYIFWTRLESHAYASLMGLSFLLCQLAASFSTEIYSSKGMITFSVVVLAGLLASTFRKNAFDDCW